MITDFPASFDHLHNQDFGREGTAQIVIVSIYLSNTEKLQWLEHHCYIKGNYGKILQTTSLVAGRDVEKEADS